MDDIDIKIKNNISTPLTNISISKGSDNIKELYRWNYSNYIIICYGWATEILV